MISKAKKMRIMNVLGKNPRSGFSEISRLTGVPVSTVYDFYKKEVEPNVEFVMLPIECGKALKKQTRAWWKKFIDHNRRRWTW
jgi:hypothetical protein